MVTQCLLLTDSACENAVADSETKVRDELPSKLDATYAKSGPQPRTRRSSSDTRA